MTGCFKRDDLEGVDILTTVYPIEYVTNYLYGESSNVSSIYPAEVDFTKYELTDKQVKEYSKSAIFVYNGLTNERGFARDFLNSNRNLKIIDVSQGLEFEYNTIELWLNPSDFLMLAHNVKNGLEEYISNKYIIEEIEKKYEDLKIMISGMDAELELMPENGDDNHIIIANNSLSFLSKYGFDLINVDEANGEVPANTMTKAKKLIQDKKVKYVFMLDTDTETETIKSLVSLGAKVKVLKSMSIRSEEDKTNGVDYKTMMRDNIDSLKEEIYN